MLESEIQSSIIDYLTILEQQRKIFFQRTNNTAIYDPIRKKFRSRAKVQKKGFPDILILVNGTCIGLEVKTATGRQSTEQKAVQECFYLQKAKYYIVRSLEEVKKILENYLPR